MIASIQRADRILELFSTDVPSWSVTEMSRELGLSKSVIWEYATTLEHLGILRVDGEKRYRLGGRMFHLGLRSRMTSEISAPARLEIVSLATELQETVQLASRHYGEVIYLEKMAPRSGVKLNATRVGERLPAHTTAGGNVLLSSLTTAEIAELYPEEALPQRTETSLGTRRQLQERLQLVSARGVAEDNEETFKGLKCIAVPVTNRHGDVAWALSVTFYSYKSTGYSKLYQDKLEAAANRLSEVTAGQG